MALANDDDVVKTFPSVRADQRRRDRSVANAHGPDAPDEASTIRATTNMSIDAMASA
jgi:hypothetical protein